MKDINYTECLNRAMEVVPHVLELMAKSLSHMNEEDFEVIFNGDSTTGHVLRLMVGYEPLDAEEILEQFKIEEWENAGMPTFGTPECDVAWKKAEARFALIETEVAA